MNQHQSYLAIVALEPAQERRGEPRFDLVATSFIFCTKPKQSSIEGDSPSDLIAIGSVCVCKYMYSVLAGILVPVLV